MKNMNKHLEQLIQLSNYDKEIASFEPKIKQEKEKLKVFTKTVDELKAKIEKLYNEIDEAKNKRIKNDLHLKELNDRLADIEKKYGEVKSVKEEKALQLEEEIAKEQIKFANDEIIRLDNLTNDKENEVERLKQELQEEENSVLEITQQIDQNIKEFEEMRAKLSQDKAKLIEQIDKKILSFYEKIKRWAGESAVVPVRNQACYGCYMKLTNRIYSEFLASDEINTCPHCGRIIYKEENIEE
jgi:predicted  nucleic acid-binding Zn-ribbon protein